MKKFGVTINGFQIRYYEDILNEMIIEYQKHFKNANIRDDNPAIIFLKLNAMQQAKTWLSMLDVYNSKFISTAKGMSLDYLSKMIGLHRLGEKPAIAKLKIEGEIGYEISLGTQFKSKNGIIFKSTDNYLINSAGGIEIKVISAIGGSKVNQSPQEIFETVNAIKEISKVTFLGHVVYGEDVESDEELRKRYLKSVGKSGGANLDSIIAAILHETSAIRATGVENNRNTPMVRSQYTGKIGELPPHSIEIITAGGNNYDIAKVIHEKKSAGIKTVGEIKVIIDSEDVYFTPAKEKSIYINIEILADEYFKTEHLDIIKNNYKRYFEGLTIGSKISGNAMLSQIYIDTVGVKESKLNFGVDKITSNTADIVCEYNEIPAINIVDIKIIR